MTIKIKPYIKALGLFSVFCLGFLLIINWVEHSNRFNFLVWNLFLGFIPFLAALATNYFQAKINKVLTAILVFIWLIFYPNAPYMITDFIHIVPSSKMKVYDDLLIFSFAMLSLYYGFYSLKLTEKTISIYYKSKVAKIIIILALFLSSFGIYLGRVLRLNSWDIVTHFWNTAQTIFEHLFPITKNPATYVMIILFTIIQWLLLQLTQNFTDE